MKITLTELLVDAAAAGASDLHLVAGRPPVHRVYGRLETSPRAALDSEELRALLLAELTAAQVLRFDADHELCISLQLPDLGFFRLNLATELGRVDASIRLGHKQIPSLKSLGIPDAFVEQIHRPDGLVLVTGPTGVGKTTTLNSVVSRVNAEERKKVVMIEDPIEFIHPAGRALVVQREIGVDASGFDRAVIHALRQDPDIVVIGELRDLSTIATALTAAETGHLVLGTLHTTGAAGTISRIVDVFPQGKQTQVRTQLAATLQAVLTQRLLPRADGGGRVLAYELLIVTDAVRNMIRDNKAHQISNVLQTGRSLGMQPMDQMIRDLYEAGDITWDVAVAAVSDRRVIERR